MKRNSSLHKTDFGGFMREILGNARVMCVVAFFLLFSVSCVLEFTHQETKTAKVLSINTQQRTQGDKDGFTTTYSYLVSTDEGVFEISPDGLMASPYFGTLKEGSYYVISLRGFSFPIIGLYPYIIDVKELNTNYKNEN